MRCAFLVIPLLLVAFLAGCSAESSTVQETTPNTHPNIVFVLADDLDYALGQRMPTTTTEIAAKGASFGNAFNSYPLCCPSRATILTGLYAHNHHVEANSKRQNGGWQKFQEEGYEQSTIAVTLHDAGYRTGLFGKYLNGYEGDEPPPGWDEWAATRPSRGDEYYNYDLNENGRAVHYGNEAEDYLTDVLSGKITQFIADASASAQPFFAYVAPSAPHGPATPAERHKNVFVDETAPRPPSFNEDDVSDKPPWIRETDRRSDEEVLAIDGGYRERLSTMLAVDEMVASILEELEAAEQLNNTYVFFASDNGYHQGEHRIGGKLFPYEESAKTPLFVRGPGLTPGSTIDELVLNTDYVETWAELGGATFDGDGRSLMPLLEGDRPSWRSSILLERFYTNEPPPPYEGVRTKTHKYVEYSSGETELYDLANDPYELENISSTADSSVVEDLKRKLDALRGCAGQACDEAEDAP